MDKMAIEYLGILFDVRFVYQKGEPRITNAPVEECYQGEPSHLSEMVVFHAQDDITDVLSEKAIEEIEALVLEELEG